MKKTYMIPQMDVVKIESHQLMAGSPGLEGEYGGGTILAPGVEEFDNTVEF